MVLFGKKKRKLLNVSIRQGNKIRHIGMYPDVETQERVKLLCKEWYPGCIIINE